MTDFNEKFRVVMLQGAKGEPYDDTQLRQDINEMLANVPYIKYTEDNGFELPIYTINDNSVTAYSCWSSQKIANTYPQVTYTIDNSNNITCDKSYNEILNIVNPPQVNIDYKGEKCIANSIRNLQSIRFEISAELNNAHISINHTINNDIGFEVQSNEDIKRIKFVDVETNEGVGETLFTCPNKPHLLNIVKKSTGSNMIEYTNGIGTIVSGASSGYTYPRVSLSDETGTTANTYGIVVDTFEKTSGTYTVAIAY